MKLEFSGHIFEKRSNIKFPENPSSAIGIIPCGPTDRHDEVLVAFSNSANVPKTQITETSGIIFGVSKFPDDKPCTHFAKEP